MRSCWLELCRRLVLLRQVRSAGLVWLFLRIFTFAAAVPVLIRLRLPSLDQWLERSILAARENNSPASIVQCVESVLAVGAPLVRRKCLTRGLTLYYFLRRAGEDVTLCLGARFRDGQFLKGIGHCWLEKQGQPFLERTDPYSYSRPIYRLPAQRPPANEESA